MRKRASTADKLKTFREDCRKHFDHRLKSDGSFKPEPNPNMFEPMYRHFAERILEEERKVFEKRRASA
jgi:hypothetical protein